MGKKHIDMHLEHITAKNLSDFRLKAFMSMASCTTSKGNVEIGVNAFSEFVVKQGNSREGTTNFYKDPFDAIVKYKELINEE